MAGPQPTTGQVSTQTTGGFFPGIFVAGFDHKFVCCVCHCILRDPVQGYCGHRFCRNCRDQLLRAPDAASLDCPGCVEENIDPAEIGKLAETQMFPDNAVRREMANMPTVCVFPGCTWRGKFRDYEAHEKRCEFRQVTCPLCGQPVADGRLAEHQANDCPQRLVTCEYCGAEMPAKRIKAHQDQCEKVPIVCERCSAVVIREKMKDHLEKSCPKRTIMCPMGCAEQFELDRLSEHLRYQNLSICIGLSLQDILCMSICNK